MKKIQKKRKHKIIETIDIPISSAVTTSVIEVEPFLEAIED